MAKSIKQARTLIIELVNGFLGIDVEVLKNTNQDHSDLALIALLLEDLCEKVERLDGHSHTIN